VTKSTLNRQDLVRESCIKQGIEPTELQLKKSNNVLWYNKINEKSLRLTHDGLIWFSRSNKFHNITLADPVRPKQMLQLERLLTSPYYLRQMAQNPAIFVSSEQDAIMLQLHGGDLNTYLDNLQDNP
jgi:hypothetical protein